MSRNTHSGRRWGLVALALTIALVAASPAAAKGPVLNPNACMPASPEAIKAQASGHGQCQRTGAGDSQGLTGEGAGIVAGGVALLVLTMAGLMLVATHRRDAHGTQPAALTGVKPS